MMLKRCLIFLLLAASQLSAGTAVMTEESVKKTLSHRQDVILCSIIFASNSVMGWIISKPLFNRLRSQDVGVIAKALWVIAALGASVALTKTEDKFFNKFPGLLGPCEDSETKQENVPC
jgi:hypothetical protein